MNDKGLAVHDNPVIINKPCYVAFLDLLAFKEIVKNWEPERVSEIFSGLIDMSNLLKRCKATAINSGSNKAVEYFNNCHKGLFIYIMSDSIVLAIESSYERNLHFLLYVCDYFQKYLFESAKVILRGGVSSGIFYGNGSIAFGRGFVDAYLFEEETLTPRVVIDPKLKTVLDDNCNDWFYATNEDTDFVYVDWLNGLNIDTNEIISHCDEQIISHDSERVKEKYLWIKSKLIV